MRRLLLMAGVLLALSASSARADDADLFAGLIPGQPMGEDALADVVGKGSSGSSSSDSASAFPSIGARRKVAELFRNAGLHAPLTPAAGLKADPPRDLSVISTGRASLPHFSSASLPSVTRALDSVSVPRVPTFGHTAGFSGGSSSVSR